MYTYVYEYLQQSICSLNGLRLPMLCLHSPRVVAAPASVLFMPLRNVSVCVCYFYDYVLFVMLISCLCHAYDKRFQVPPPPSSWVPIWYVHLATHLGAPHKIQFRFNCALNATTNWAILLPKIVNCRAKTVERMWSAECEDCLRRDSSV